jgi:hypothetical protein
MGKKNEADSDDSRSIEEACIDDKNLFNPLVIKNAMAEESTAWDEIELQTFDCYYDCIICNLDPNSPPWEEDVQLDQMDEDVANSAVMRPTMVSQDGDHHYTAMMTLLSLTRGKNMKGCSERTVYRSHTVKTSCISIRSISKRPKIIVMVLGVIVVWLAEQTLAIGRIQISLSAKRKRELYSSTITSSCNFLVNTNKTL